MNLGATSKEAIMAACRHIVSEKGLKALNMRAVADKCHIALGTLYNYYSDKNDLVLATIESVWMDIFHMDGDYAPGLSFPDYVKHIFESVQHGVRKYPDFFMAHAVGIANSERSRAKNAMADYFNHMEAGMLKILDGDSDVNPHAFSQSFSKTDFVNFVIENILILLVREKRDCNALIEIIRKIIYQR
ncbi:MAG: TetR/AcrR family transcriptional regulator [Butyrivibrio sp.]